MLIVMERIAKTYVCIDATYGEVHARQLVCGLGIFLSVDRDVLLVAVVRFYELHRLHEHTARTAARVINFAVVWLNHLSDKIHDALRRVELTLALTLGNGELAQKELVDTTDDVVLLVFERVELVNLVEQGGKLGAVESEITVIVGRQSAIELLVRLLDVGKCVVYNLEDIVLLGVLHDIRPTTFCRDIEHVVLSVELHHVSIVIAVLLTNLLMLLVEMVAGIFQEDKTQHHMLVFGRLHRSAHLVARLPQSFLHAFGRFCLCCFFCHCFCMYFINQR